MRKVGVILMLGMLLTVMLGAGRAAILAQSAPPDRAGLVIVQPDQDPLTFCVELDEAGMMGTKLLERVGVDFIADYSNSMGAAICRIDRVGCDYPGQECFCQCQGATCTYWSYHWLDPGSSTWRYAQFGATQTQVAPGSVQAWVWSSGDADATQIQPPDVSFTDICAGETSAAAAEIVRPNWPAYLGFVGLLLILAGAGVWRRHAAG